LSGSEIRYGFDFKERKLTLFDDGKQKHSCSTWPQVGRAVAKLLSLPVSGPSPCLDDWKNGCVHINSFDLSQQDMFESVLRVTHTKESDWTISHENTKERYQRGQEMFKQGDWHGFGTVSPVEYSCVQCDPADCCSSRTRACSTPTVRASGRISTTRS